MDGGAGVGNWRRWRALGFAGAGLIALLVLLGTASSALAANAAFTATPSTQQAGQPVSFDASGSAFSAGATKITDYVWNFGDGSQTQQTTSPTISYSYSKGGRYTVTLIVVDDTGQTGQSSQQVNIVAPPTAAFNPTEATVLAGSAVHFDGTQSNDPDGTIAGYSWNFGDGSTSTAAQPSHSYTMPGTYNVKLTATDNHGESSAVTHQITVIAPPPIQTLVESIIPAPILVKFGSPSVMGHALVDLKERLFCPGSGPACQTTITEPKTGLARDRRRMARAAAKNVLTTRPNRNAELALHLTSAQWKTLVSKHRLSVSLTLVSVRGAEKVTSTLRLKLARKG
jgi:PKD repeat protein